MDDDRENEEEQSEREASPTTTATSASVPRPDRVDAIVRGSDRTSSFGVLVDSGDSDGAVDDGLTEEERETVGVHMHITLQMYIPYILE